MSNLPASSPISVASSAHKLSKSSASKFLVRLELPTRDPGVETEDYIGDLTPPFVTAVEKRRREERSDKDTFTPVQKMPCGQ